MSSPPFSLLVLDPSPACPVRSRFDAPLTGDYALPVRDLLSWGRNLNEERAARVARKVDRWRPAVPDLARMVVDEGLLKETLNLYSILVAFQISDAGTYNPARSSSSFSARSRRCSSRRRVMYRCQVLSCPIRRCRSRTRSRSSVALT